LPAHLQTVDAGKAQVQDHDIGVGLARHRDGAGSVEDHDRLELIAFQIAGHHLGQWCLVVHYQRPVALRPAWRWR
jgi:hypothetical protein